jgi:catalase
VRSELFADHYSQARLFWRSLTDNERAHVASSFVFELSKVGLEAVPARMVANLRNVEEELATRVADGLGIDLPTKSKAAREPIDMTVSPALSIQKNMKPILTGRAVGILFADGSDASEIHDLRAAIQSAGGKAVLIAPKIGGAKLSDGEMQKADGQLAGTPSQTVDAIAVVLSKEGCMKLVNDAAAVQFVMDAFGHLKAIGASAASQPLLDKAGVKVDAGITDLSRKFLDAATKRYWDRERSLRQLA